MKNYDIPPIIAFCGNIASGKSIFADILATTLKDKIFSKKRHLVRQVSFAKEVKEAAKFFVPIVGKRKAFQDIGEFGRSVYGDGFWLNRTKETVNNYDYKCLIIDDLRFENEAEWVLGCGGMIFLLCLSDNLRRLRAEKRDGKLYRTLEWAQIHSRSSETSVAQVINSYKDHIRCKVIYQESDDIKIHMNEILNSLGLFGNK